MLELVFDFLTLRETSRRPPRAVMGSFKDLDFKSTAEALCSKNWGKEEKRGVM